MGVPWLVTFLDWDEPMCPFTPLDSHTVPTPPLDKESRLPYSTPEALSCRAEAESAVID